MLCRTTLSAPRCSGLCSSACVCVCVPFVVARGVCAVLSGLVCAAESEVYVSLCARYDIVERYPAIIRTCLPCDVCVCVCRMCVCTSTRHMSHACDAASYALYVLSVCMCVRAHAVCVSGMLAFVCTS